MTETKTVLDEAIEAGVWSLRQIRDDGPGLIAQHGDSLDALNAALRSLREARERAVEGWASDLGNNGFAFLRKEACPFDAPRFYSPALLLPLTPEEPKP